MAEQLLRRDVRSKAICLAIRRLETGRVRVVPAGTKLSISSVAREAGIHPATIHTTYPDLAERIRHLTGHELRAQRDKVAVSLKELRKKYAALRTELRQLKADLASVTSRYAAARIEIERLRDNEMLRR